jgi:hypothetical protein
MMEFRHILRVKGLKAFAFRRLVLGMTACCFLFSCAKEKKPDQILSKEEVVNVMAQLYISEQKVLVLGLNGDSARKVFDRMRAKTFDKAGVPDSIFKKSFNYYVDRPSELEWIYTALMDSLQLQEQRVAMPDSKRPEKK